MTEIVRLQFRKGTAAAWTAANPVLLLGEPGFETDTNEYKFGDGVTPWVGLPYFSRPKRGILIVMCVAFDPGSTGPDVGEVPVPFDPADGTTSVTWTVRRIDLRVSTAGGSPGLSIEKSTVSGAFVSAATVGSVALAPGAYEGNTAGVLGTATSGDKLRMNISALGTALGWTVTVLLGET